MKRVLLIPLFILSLSVSISAKDYNDDKNTVGMGVLFGGSLVGIEYERLVTERTGFTCGAAFIGSNAGLNYHFSNTIHSSFIHAGGGVSYSRSPIIFPYLEVSLNLRFIRFIQISLGGGMNLYNENYLDHHIGRFFPLATVGVYASF